MSGLDERLAALEAEVAELRQSVRFTMTLADAFRQEGYREGRASSLGTRAATPRPPRSRHLSVIEGAS